MQVDLATDNYTRNSNFSFKLLLSVIVTIITQMLNDYVYMMMLYLMRVIVQISSKFQTKVKLEMPQYPNWFILYFLHVYQPAFIKK